jgi:FkbM family methyltransferase
MDARGELTMARPEDVQVVAKAWRLYMVVRRAVRSTLIDHPSLERLLLAPLVTVEGVVVSPERLARRAPNPLGVDGHRLWHRPEDASVILPMVLYGAYEPETTAWLRESLGPGMTFVDLGAHIGYYTLLAARAVGPSGRVFAFEPTRGTFEILRRNVELNGYGAVVTLVQHAVCERSGPVTMFLDAATSVSAKMFQVDATQPCESVEAVSLDEYFAGFGWPSVHIVKLDIEGAERPAIDGMAELLRRNEKIRLIVELNRANLRGTATPLEELVDTLLKRGFSTFTPLWRRPKALRLPDEMAALDALVRRANVNLLCERP